MTYTKTILNGIKVWVEKRFSTFNTELNKKVTSIEGKGLSTEDYTTDEKNYLNNIIDTDVLETFAPKDYIDSKVPSNPQPFQHLAVNSNGNPVWETPTHYKSDINNHTVEFDISNASNGYNKVSDLTPSLEEFIDDNNECKIEGTYASQWKDYYLVFNGGYGRYTAGLNIAIMVITGPCPVIYNDFTFTETGMYFLYGRLGYVSRFSWGDKKLLSESYIDTAIPRVKSAKVNQVLTPIGVDESNNNYPVAWQAIYVPYVETAQVGQTVIVKKTDEQNVPIKWETTDIPKIDSTLSIEGAGADAKATKDMIYMEKEYLALTDQVTGYRYLISIENGNLISKIGTKSIEVTTMPTKTEYIAGDYFDPTGMTVVAISEDNVTTEIKNFTYLPQCLTEYTTSVEISYTEASKNITVSIPVNVNPYNFETALVDFAYEANKDDTYTIIDWKGTLSNNPSTELTVPDNGLIKIKIEEE